MVNTPEMVKEGLDHQPELKKTEREQTLSKRLHFVQTLPHLPFSIACLLSKCTWGSILGMSSQKPIIVNEI